MNKINEKINAQNVELQQIQKRLNENKKLAEERQKLIDSLECNLRMFNLEIDEVQSVEYPEDVDVEVMVEYFIFVNYFARHQN